VVGCVAFGTLRLSAGAPEWDSENLTGLGGPIVGVPRRPMRFAWAGSSREVVGSAAVALFSNENQSYRKRAITDAGETTDWVWARPEVTAGLIEMASGRGPSDERRPFGFMSGPVSSATSVQLRALGALAGGEHDPVLCEELALHALGGLLGPAYEASGVGPRSKAPRRRTTDEAHHDAVNDAMTLMSLRCTERLTLADVARAAHMSPLHFCRIFRARTGMTVHNCLTRLRLAWALDLLEDPAVSIADAAIRSGFAGGNHLADVCRANTGHTPRSARRLARADRAELARSLHRAPGKRAGTR